MNAWMDTVNTDRYTHINRQIYTYYYHGNRCKISISDKVFTIYCKLLSIYNIDIIVHIGIIIGLKLIYAKTEKIVKQFK